MTATAVHATIPHPRTPESAGPAEPRAQAGATCRAVAYQRVLHQVARREWRMLGELATWARPGDAERTATLTRHADLIGRVLLHHHAVEREAVWPALLRAVPADAVAEASAAVEDAIVRCARIDRMLRDVMTAGRQWAVAGTVAARDRFAGACLDLADAVDAQTADEERRLLPLVAAHLGADDWAEIARSSRCRLSGREQMLVLGLALEDACAADRARLLSGAPRATRVAWRTSGARTYRAAVIRLRGAPPAT